MACSLLSLRKGAKLSLALVAGLAASMASASLTAFDTASDVVYNPGWSSGQNGGYGFGPWSMTTAGNSGTFVGNSNNNGGGGGPGINTPVDRAWGMWANNGGSVTATRPFIGALNVGDVYSIDMDNGWIDDNRSVGFGLGNPGQWQFEFLFAGGGQFYMINDVAGLQATTIGFTDGGLHATYKKTGPYTYDFSVTRLSDNLTYTHSGVIHGQLFNDNIQDLSYLWNNSAGSDPQRDAYFNSMGIVPEPGTVVAIGVGLASLIRRRKQR